MLLKVQSADFSRLKREERHAEVPVRRPEAGGYLDEQFGRRVDVVESSHRLLSSCAKNTLATINLSDKRMRRKGITIRPQCGQKPSRACRGQ